MTKDMTEGKPSLVLIRFALPMILSGIFQQLYNVVDSIVAGKYAGVDALAAVGASYPIAMLFIAIATGSGLGCAVIVSQLFGAKKYLSMKSAIITSLISIVILAVIVMFFGILFCNNLISLLNTPENIFNDSALYLRIYIYGIMFLFLYNISTSIYNGLGDSKTPLYFLIFSSCLNIFLDILFVKEFNMGVAGVAWATFIAQGISSILALGNLIRRLSKIKVDEEYKKFDITLLKHMGRIALPSIFQQSTIAIGQLGVQVLVNSFGSVVIAGYSAAIKIDSFFKVPVQTMGNAVSSFSAQNYGAEKYDRINDGYKSAIKVMLLYSLIAIVIVFTFGNMLIGLFTSGDTSAEVISVGVQYMRIVSAFYMIFSIMLVGNGVLRGTGCMKAFTVSTFVDLVIRVGSSYALAYYIDYNAIWWAISIGWTVGMIITTYFFIKGNWRKNIKNI